MPDNIETKAASTIPVATDVVTYSGDANQNVQLLRMVEVTGAEGSKTVISPYAKISTANSSDAELANGAAFTGAGEDVSDFAAIQIFAYASHASATDGLSLQFSIDNTNWRTVDTFTVAATTPRLISLAAAARYFRIVYTNGGVTQTTFELQTILHYRNVKPSSNRQSDARSNEMDVEEVAAYGSVFNGTTWDRLRGDTNGGQVQGAAAGGAAVAGKPVLTGGSDGTNARTIATDTAGNSTSVGNIAHDGVDSGAPVKIGAKALAHGASPTAVAAADRTDLYANRHGVQFVIGGHPNIVTLRATYAAAAQTNAAIVTASAGTKIVVTQIQVAVSNSTTNTPLVRIGFATATTPTTTGVLFSHPGIPGGGAPSRGDGSGIIGAGADDEDVRITSDAATAGTIDVVLSYFLIES